MKVLLAGLGRWGKNHLRVLAGLSEVELYVCDADPSRAALLSDHGIPQDRFSTSFGDSLGKVDAVFVVTPAQVHTPLVLEALGAGCDVFIEKPICLDYGEAIRIHEEAEKRNAVLQVGHIFRFHPVTVRCRERLLAPEAFGQVRYLKGAFKGFKRPRMDVGVTMTDTIHFADLFSHLLGEWPEAVFGSSWEILHRGMDDLSLSHLFFGSGAVGFIESGYFQHRTLREVMIAGDRASLVADYKSGTITVQENVHIEKNGAWEARVGEPRKLDIEGPEPLTTEDRAFLECVKTRKKPAVTALDGAKALRIIEKLYESAAKGQRVPVDY